MTASRNKIFNGLFSLRINLISKNRISKYNPAITKAPTNVYVFINIRQKNHINILPHYKVSIPVKTGGFFNDTDSVVNYNKNLSSTNNPPAEDIAAPKTIDRLEKISQIRNDQRKLDEAEEDDDGDKLTIFSDAPSLKLDALDVQVLDNNLSLKKPPVLTGIETL